MEYYLVYYTEKGNPESATHAVYVEEVGQELAGADEFWNFLGSVGTYEDLLDCFEQVGIELRPEIDAYFGKFKGF